VSIQNNPTVQDIFNMLPDERKERVLDFMTNELVEHIRNGQGETAKNGSDGYVRNGNGQKKRRRQGRRSPEELDEDTSAILNFIRKNPGSSAEEISEATGLETKDLQVPIHHLLDDKHIRRRGQKRATKYFPRKVGGKKTAYV